MKGHAAEHVTGRLFSPLRLLFVPLLLLLPLLSGCLSTDMGGYVNLPPLVTITPEDPVTGKTSHVQSLGPLWESWKTPPELGREELFLALRPFGSFVKDPSGTQLDLLWPFSTYRTGRGGKSLFRCFPYFQSSHPTGKNEIFLFPFFYYGNDSRANPSFCLFPFYGKLGNTVGGKNIEFILFPLYIRRDQKMAESHSLFWPFFLWETGPAHRKMRLFPLWAFREQFHLRKHYSLFWPLFNFAHSLDASSPGFAFLSFPLGGYESWGKTRNYSLFWPVFSWQTTPDGVNFNGPWPLFRYGKSKQDSRHLFLWPLLGNAKLRGTDYAYFLWPLGFYLQNKIPGKGSSRFLCMLPFYLSHTSRSPAGKIEKSYRHLYPFFSRNKAENEVIQKAPDFTPIRKSDAAERNLLRLLTFFSSCSNEKGLSWEILWGLTRNSETKDRSLLAIGPFYMHVADRKKQELLLDIFFGCVKVYKRGEKSCVRLFHLLEIGSVPPLPEKEERKK